MLRRNFLKLAAFLAVPTSLFGKQEKTGYIPDNAIKTEEKAAQELYRQFKKKDDFGCDKLRLWTSSTLYYDTTKKSGVTSVVLTWYKVTPKESKNVTKSSELSIAFNINTDCVSTKTDYLDEDKLRKCIIKRFNGYKISRNNFT